MQNFYNEVVKNTNNVISNREEKWNKEVEEFLSDGRFEEQIRQGILDASNRGESGHTYIIYPEKIFFNKKEKIRNDALNIIGKKLQGEGFIYYCVQQTSYDGFMHYVHHFHWKKELSNE